MIDKYWIKMWKFFLMVVVLACFLMGILAAMNVSCQRSGECIGEEAEAIDGITNSLWDEFKVTIPIMIFMLLISFLLYIKFEFVSQNTNEEKRE